MTGSIKVTNISRHVDSTIVKNLFSFVGDVVHVELRQSMINPEVQEALVEFVDAQSIKPALFLSGAELAERALVVSEETAMLPAAVAAMGIGSSGMRAATAAGVGVGSAHALPLANPAVVAMMAGRTRTLTAIPGNLASIIHPSTLQFDPVKAEEISRTIYVGNIASNVVEQQLMDFFSVCGPVAYVKMAGDGLQPTRFAFVEFAEMATAQAALQMNGMMLADRPLKVNHSKNAINKPPLGRSLAPSAVAPLSLPPIPQVPTLAAMASLPSSADPLAASLLAARTQPGQGLAWPVLGNVNPAMHAAEGDSPLARRLRELQTQMEDKYASRVAAIRRRSPSRRRSRDSPRRSRERSQDLARRGRERSRDQTRHSRERSSRRSGRDDDAAADDDYIRGRRSRRSDRDRDREDADGSWYTRRHRDYRSRSAERHHRRRP